MCTGLLEESRMYYYLKQMRRIVFYIAIGALICCAEPVAAQLGVGIKGGTQFASVDFNFRPEFIPREVSTVRNAQYGMIIRYAGKKNAGLQLEVNLTNKGWKDVNDTSDVRYTRNIRYVEIPFMSHFYLGNGKFRLIAEGGPYVAYALSSDQTEFDPDTEEEMRSTYNFVDGRDNRWDYGLVAQGGIQYKLSFGAFHAEAFYSLGYGNIFADKSESLEISQHRVYGITVGYVHFITKLD